MTDQLVASMYTTWLPSDWTSDGIDNGPFSGGFVPCAIESEGEKDAAKKFARAHRSQKVTNLPRYLVKIKIPVQNALYHITRNPPEIRIFAERERPEFTIGFAKPLNKTNYPTMQVDSTEIDAGARQQLLDYGLELLDAGT
jgi:hypothetical protein